MSEERADKERVQRAIRRLTEAAEIAENADPRTYWVHRDDLLGAIGEGVDEGDYVRVRVTP